MSVPAVLHPFAVPAREADDFLNIVRAEGSVLWSEDGSRYLDGTASLWYCAAGHGRREIVDAVARQMSELDAYHTFGRFTNPPQEELARQLVALGPVPDARILFTQGGSEGVDSALKLARVAHRLAGEGHRTVILGRHFAYHGVMFGGISAGGLPANRTSFGPLLPDVHTVDRDSLQAMRDAVAYHGPDRVAAIIAEPVIGAGGVFPPTEGYLQGLRELCDEVGALLIFDEVINGFGRLGSWFGALHFGVTPDLLIFAKGVTSGYMPLGGVFVGPAVRERLEGDPSFILAHGTTYAGHPSCCAAGLANLEILRREDLPARAGQAGQRLRAGLDTLADRPGVLEIRGEGLMQAIGLEAPLAAPSFAEALLARGLVARAIPYANTVAFSPPLIITDEEIDELVEVAGAALADVAVPAG
jgi:adenosylmethionine-8-amino-7-oxononanoate aminotransferase